MLHSDLRFMPIPSVLAFLQVFRPAEHATTISDADGGCPAPSPPGKIIRPVWAQTMPVIESEIDYLFWKG
jgi:hypothetical protein